MKVRVHQTSPALLDVKANLEEVIEKIRKGGEEGVDLAVFPELALTGYFVGQRYHEVSLTMDSREIKTIAEATRGTAAVVGFIEESPAMNFYNSALVAVDGVIAFAYRKLNLPNYGVFEERKFFASGKFLPVFKLHGFTLAVFICNDLWHPSLPYLGVTQKADIFITLFNSSEGSMGDEFSNINTWGIINTFYSRIFGVYNICANRVGEEGLNVNPILKNADSDGNVVSLTQDVKCDRQTYHFWGGSEIINPYGKSIAKAPLHETAAIEAEIARDLLRRKKVLLPYLRNDDPYFTHRELERILYGK
ncbi:MAG: nitrilase [Deltaproteobacteria bacterium]|nr:nitrilase [Deltaproteobacteria bacterium]